MNGIGKTLLVLCVSSVALFASEIDGKWRSEQQVGDADGKTYSHVSIIALKDDGGVLTGTIVAISEAPWMKTTTGKSYDIKDGKFDGGKFSFKVVQESDTGDRTTLYEGTVDGARLKGIIKFRGIGQSWTLNAPRVD